MSGKAGGERKQAGSEEKKATSGGRAERSEVIHETRQERGVKRQAEWNLIQQLKRVMDFYLEEEAKLPSKFANQPELSSTVWCGPIFTGLSAMIIFHC